MSLSTDISHYHRGEVLAIFGVGVGVGERFGAAAAAALVRFAITCIFLFKAASR